MSSKMLLALIVLMMCVKAINCYCYVFLEAMLPAVIEYLIGCKYLCLPGHWDAWLRKLSRKGYVFMGKW